MIYKIGEETDGMTVRQYVFSCLKLSRAMVTRLKNKENGISLNGRTVTVRALLRKGDELSLLIEDAENEINRDITPSHSELCIAYEDEYIIAINKKGHMPVHPSRNHHGDCLANALAAYNLERGQVFNFRAVNRIDSDTSGLVMVAKNAVAANFFSRMIAERKIKKSYIALLDGIVEIEKGRIDTYIRREKESIITRCNCPENEGGARAVTDWELIRVTDGNSLVLASPITGRTHQLRVHFAGIGHPVLGDTLYGKESALIDRQALHAYRLEFVHPFTNEDTVITAELPDDMRVLTGEQSIGSI